MSKKFCDQCGVEMDVSAKFCASCGAKVDDVVSNDKTATVKVDKAKNDSKNMGFDFSNLNFANILKFGVVGLIIALIIGIIFLNLTWGTISTSIYYTDTGLTWLSFIIGVIIAVGLLSAHMKDKTEAIIMGLFVGLLTGLLESSIVSMFMGRQFAFWFDTFIGNQALILIVIGVVIAYVGNVYLKDKIHLEIINNYLGE